MTLPTAEQVKAIVATDLSDAVVDSIIADAFLMAERCITSLSDERQTAIVKWLAAHLIASTDESATVSSSKLGDAQDTYMRATTGERLMGTTYGQQALALDPNGCLARLGNPRATFERV